MTDKYIKILLSIVMGLVFSTIGFGQSTEFTYQGRLLDSSLPPTANYDFEFSLWNSLANGTQQGSTQTVSGVAVSNGIFTVRLDFGAQFDGSARFLQITVRPAGGGTYTTLAPRQPITAAPYAIRSLNSTTADTATNSLNLGGVVANQFVQTTDPRMTDARNPLPSSANYIWNQNSVLQPSSNFVISGNGFVGGLLEAGAVNVSGNLTVNGTLTADLPSGDTSYIQNQNAAPQSVSNFYISGDGRASGTLRANIIDGSDGIYSSGRHVISLRGSSNVLAGNYAGEDITTGDRNSLFGEYAGEDITTGSDNSFFGYSAGSFNSQGFGNTFIGSRAGSSSSNATASTFVGQSAGIEASGSRNTFVGSQSGAVTTTGDRNAFFGNNTGSANTVGSNNTIIGSDADVLGNNLRNATALGYRAIVGADHSLVLGSIAGINGCGDFGSFCESVNVGIGTTTPLSRLHIVGGTDAELASGGYLVAGDVASVNLVIDNNEIIARDNGATSQLYLNAEGGNVTLIQSGLGNVGIGISSPQDKLHVDGIIRVATLGAAGATNVCRNANNQLSTCSSSLRYKTNINRFGLGLDLIKKLKPITFDWKDGGTHDLGLGAEEVAGIEPLLVTYNKAGQVEGVKYDRIGVVLVNAVKEQQAEIDAQRSAISRQQSVIELQQKQIDTLKKLVCAQNASAEICKEER